MAWHKEIWTYLIVTVVAALIWFWAAGETRENKRLDFARVQFTVAEAADWIITPVQQPMIIAVEGSKLAIQQSEQLLRRPLRMTIPATSGRQTIDLLERLREHDAIRSTGVTVRAVEPAAVEVDLDQIERLSARVKSALPGVVTEGEVAIDPPEVTVAMPSRMRARFPQGLTVEAFVERSDLEKLDPGVRQTMEAKLRLPEGVGPSNEITMTPSKVSMSFAIRSRVRETRLESVRVQLAGPPEDRDAFIVEVEPKQFRNVTISADADLIRRIESNEVPVVAIVHLSSREKEARIDTKKVTSFIALLPEPDGSTRGVQVEAKIGDSNEMPSVKLRIVERGGS